MNPLLAKVKLPGRVFQLPSRGLFYQRGVLAAHVKDAEVQVKPMSALAEMKLRSADLLLSGKIIRELCEECIPEILKPEKLVGPDVDAIFAFLRVVTHGAIIKLRSIHTCANAEVHDHESDLEAILTKPNNMLLDHKDIAFKLTLSNGQVVALRPSSYEEAMRVITIMQELVRQEADGKEYDEKLATKATVLDLLNMIESVEDGGEVVDDFEMLDEWVRALSSSLMAEIKAGISKINRWGFDFKVQLSCPDCGEQYLHDLDLDPIAFFFG